MVAGHLADRVKYLYSVLVFLTDKARKCTFTFLESGQESGLGCEGEWFGFEQSWPLEPFVIMSPTVGPGVSRLSPGSNQPHPGPIGQLLRVIFFLVGSHMT